jgi:Ca-activated chloride channel family protein
MTRRLRPFAVLLVAAFAAVPAFGQGFLVDRRPNVPIARSFEVTNVSVDARIRDQVAEVQVSQTFHNPGSVQTESEYLFPLPEDGAVQNFVLMVDGKELPGRLLPKDEARRIYENIVRSKRDPALLEYMGGGLIRTSVFPIPPGADRTVTMRYTQIVKRERDVVEFSYPFGTQKFTAKPIRNLKLSASIDSKDPIKSIYSPSHEMTSRRDDDHHATIKVEQHDVIPSTDFRVVYTLAEGNLGASVLSYRPTGSEDGYFLLLASPRVERTDDAPRPKSVVFVLDRSGSMSGKKIEQARGALKFVLDNLRDDDLFNIIAYDDRVEPFKPELQRYSAETRKEAVSYVENIQPGGSTNIDDALRSAMSMLKDDSRPNYVLFLTDGLPTAGETKEAAITENAHRSNNVHARLFSFGVGYDVNARLLDRLSGGNGGVSEYVKPDNDIETSVARFFSKMTSPALSAIQISMAGVDLNRIYPRDIPDLFDGGQLVIVGRYHNSSSTRVKVEGKVNGARYSQEFPADLAEAGRGWSSLDFVEKLWAIRRVGFIIDQIDLHGADRELTDELVELSKKYGILTPYTSFLADETVDLNARTANADRARSDLNRLGEVQGRFGVGQREAKEFFKSADSLAVVTEPASRDERLDGFQANQPATDASSGPALAANPVFRNPVAKRAAPGLLAPQGSVASGSQTRAMGGTGGGMSGSRRFNGAGAYVTAKDFDGRDQLVTSVRTLGAKTFYKRGDRWVDADVTADDEAKAIAIEQFTDAYFRLARDQKTAENQYLTFHEPVTVKLDGQVYKIDPPKGESPVR